VARPVFKSPASKLTDSPAPTFSVNSSSPARMLLVLKRTSNVPWPVTGTFIRTLPPKASIVPLLANSALRSGALTSIVEPSLEDQIALGSIVKVLPPRYADGQMGGKSLVHVGRRRADVNCAIFPSPRPQP